MAQVPLGALLHSPLSLRAGGAVPVSQPQRLLFGAVGLYGLVLGAILWPVLGDPTRLALGHPGNDVWNHLWGTWFVADSLAHGRLPLHTELLGWPDGGALWFIDSFDALLTLPVQWAWGPVAAWNAGIAFNFWLCGLGAFLLARSVTRSGPGAVLAGLCYMTAPHLLGQAYNGIGETLAAGWLPLALLGIREAARRPSWRRGALAGLLLGLNALASWYYGLFAGLALLGLLARGAWRWGRRRGDLRPHLGALAAGAIAMGLVAGPAFLAFAASMGAKDALVGRDPGFVFMTLILHNMTDALALVRPGRFASPDLKARFDEDLIVVVYLGGALLWPALAVLGSPYSRRARSWGLLALGFLVLSLGPYLYVNGSYVHVEGDRLIPLPFLALFRWVPVMGRISHAYRFVLGATLALCVLIAWAVELLRQKGVPVWLAVVGLGLLRVGESFLGSQAVWPLPVSDAAVAPVIGELEGGAVLDLPVTVPVLARSRYVVAQLVHAQPIPYGLNDPTPLALYLNHYSRYLIELERTPAELLPATVPALDLAVGQAALVAEGLKWVVVHRSQLPTARQPKLLTFLDATSTPVYDDGELRIYRLDP